MIQRFLAITSLLFLLPPFAMLGFTVTGNEIPTALFQIGGWTMAIALMGSVILFGTTLAK